MFAPARGHARNQGGETARRMCVDKGSRPKQVSGWRHSNIFPPRPIFYFVRFGVQAHSTSVIPPSKEEATIGGGLIDGSLGRQFCAGSAPSLVTSATS
jgi:hypothetical protein